MSRRKKGSFKRLFKNNQSILTNSYSSNKNLLLLGNSYSSNKPGFIDVINKGIDDNRLKGGFRKYEKTI